MPRQKFNFNASKKILGLENPDTPGDPNSELETSPIVPDTPNPETETISRSPSDPNLETDTISRSSGDLNSQKTAHRMEIRYIPRRKIRTNKKNNYPMSELDSLEKSILQYGLQQPLTVLYIMEEDKYVLEAGHRRCTVLDQLIETYKECQNEEDEQYLLYLQNIQPYEAGYPCIVTDRLSEDMYYDVSDENLSEKAIDSEIRLIITNEEVRSTSAQVKAHNIQRLTELYTLKNKDKKRTEKININEKIAEDLNLGITQVKVYKTVNNLIPALKELFDSNNITLKEGSNYASLSEEEQFQIANLIQAGHKISEADIKAIKREKQALEEEYATNLRMLKDELENKEQELAALQKKAVKEQISVTDSEEYKKLQEDKYEMEETILELRNQILAMQNKQKAEKPKIDETSYLAKLQVKSAYAQAYKSVEEFIKLCDNYVITDKTFTEEYEALVTNLNRILKGE